MDKGGKGYEESYNFDVMPLYTGSHCVRGSDTAGGRRYCQ